MDGWCDKDDYIHDDDLYKLIDQKPKKKRLLQNIYIYYGKWIMIIIFPPFLD